MNEIQTVKNSKKGFTLVELVVVIAILAILAAIAIPVVASTIVSSQRSSAKSNAQTVELAIKEAEAAISSGDTSVFSGANSSSMTMADIAAAKKIESAVTASYTISGTTYTCYYNKADQKVVFSDGTNDIDGNTITNASTNLVALSSSGSIAAVSFPGATTTTP